MKLLLRKKYFYVIVYFFCLILVLSFTSTKTFAQKVDSTFKPSKQSRSIRTLFGMASFYSDNFNGKQTANGEIFSQKKLTCACNILPLNTWIRVTNLNNHRSIILKTNDRMHPRMKRIVDITRAAASQLNFIDAGIVRVKVEVLGKRPH